MPGSSLGCERKRGARRFPCRWSVDVIATSGASSLGIPGANGHNSCNANILIPLLLSSGTHGKALAPTSLNRGSPVPKCLLSGLHGSRRCCYRTGHDVVGVEEREGVLPFDLCRRCRQIRQVARWGGCYGWMKRLWVHEDRFVGDCGRKKKWIVVWIGMLWDLGVVREVRHRGIGKTRLVVP